LSSFSYTFSDSEEEKWHDVYMENAKPPSALTVTHVNQTHDLQVSNMLCLVQDDLFESECKHFLFSCL